MERRKLQNREAQRRYRENIKRKLKIAERQLESRRASDSSLNSFGNIGGNFGSGVCDTNNSTDSARNFEDGVASFDCQSPLLDFDWSSLTVSCQTQSGTGLLSPSESILETPPNGPSSGSTVMHIAAHKGYHTIVRMLWECGVDISTHNDSGDTPLHLAASHGHAKAIATLLDAGAEIDAMNHRGHTPLLTAVSSGHDACVKALLEGGADPNMRISGAMLGGEKPTEEDAMLRNWAFEDAGAN
ncbi:hypothetical protein VTL71DRAFT_4732 [Oculimacula yallundae]|uniref:BZIP domain-containing protein n=1 Tax=Oculimacula yallundae TaxID=86028 RepID=A0ABR4C572_9HELO